MRSHLRRPCALLLLAALLGAVLGCGVRPERPARVVLVTIDTLRADHVGCYGASRAHTPTLDGLARDGVRFESAFSPAPLTLPSHTTILTGLDPDRHGVRHNAAFKLMPDVPTLAEHMHAAGFATAAFVGAFVLDHRFGLARGFDHYDDDVGEKRSGNAMVSFAERRADKVVDAFLGWLDSAPDRFFVWVHFYDPHVEYDPPAGFALAFPGHPYDGEIAYVDAQLARLLAAVDDRFDPSGTLVVVTSDHGESLGEHGEPTHSYSVYDATQHVPLILRGPGFRGGAVVSAVVRSADIASTLLAVAGAPPLPATSGTDLRAVLAGRAPPERAYSETLATHFDYGWSALFSVRDADWRYIQAPRPELFDVHRDPAELHDVAAAHPDVARELDAWLAARRAAARPLGGARNVSADERARLRALGYVAGGFTGDGDLSGPDPKDRLDVLAALARADRASAAGRWAEAYRDLAPFDEKGSFFLATRASCAVNAGLLDAAERDIDAALAREPDRADYLDVLAAVHERRGELDEATRIQERLLAADPEDAAATAALGRLAERRGDRAAAADWYQRALAVDPENGEAHWRLAALRFAAGDAAGAEALLANAGPPPEPVVALQVAAAEAQAGQPEQAARRLEAALAERELPLELDARAAALLQAGGRLDAALRLHEILLAAHPDDWVEQNAVAWLLTQLGHDLDRALSLARSSASASKRNPAVLDTLAAAQLASGDAAAALATADHGLARTDAAVRPHLLLSRARALEALGRPAAAQRALAEALRSRKTQPGPWVAEAESLAHSLRADTSDPRDPP